MQKQIVRQGHETDGHHARRWDVDGLIVILAECIRFRFISSLEVLLVHVYMFETAQILRMCVCLSMNLKKFLVRDPVAVLVDRKTFGTRLWNVVVFEK